MEIKKRTRPDVYIHGMTGTRFYRVWDGIRQRCGNPNDDHFKYYGGRGVKCQWHKFENFKSDMLRSYKRFALKHGETNTTIDRVDNDGDYCKKNCRWKTKREQYSNKRSNLYFQYRGKQVRIRDLMAISGLDYDTIRCRIKYGWPIEKVAELPKHSRVGAN